MEHGGLGHGHSLEKELIWVPLIVHTPGRRLVGSRHVAAVARNLDVAPTILELAGVNSPKQFEGRSLLSLADGAATDGELHSFAWQGSHRSITDRYWHFIWSPETREVRLYDNLRDPAGADDVASANPEVVDEFRALAKAYEVGLNEMWRLAEGAEATSGSRPEVPESVLEQLEALGYLD
jgi:arylsulfatase A-like enzyme